MAAAAAQQSGAGRPMWGTITSAAVHHQIVPIAGTPLGFAQHAFTSEAGLLQCALLREIRDIRLRFDTSDCKGLQQIFGQQSLRLRSIPFIAMFRRDVEANVIRTAATIRAIAHHMIADRADDLALQRHDHQRRLIVVEQAARLEAGS